MAAVFLTTHLGAQNLFHLGACEAKNEHMTKQPDSTGAHLVPLEDDGASSPIRASWATQPHVPTLGALTEATVGVSAVRIAAYEVSISASSTSTQVTLVGEALDAREAGVGATSDLATTSSTASHSSSAEDATLDEATLDEALEVCSPGHHARVFAQGVRSGASCIEASDKCMVCAMNRSCEFRGCILCGCSSHAGAVLLHHRSSCII